MPRGKGQKQKSAAQMEAQIQSLKQEVSTLIVPKIQKQVVKFTQVIPIQKNAIIGPSTQYCVGADNTYRYRTTATAPEEVPNKLSTLLDCYYEMYSNVTYKHAEAHFEPYKFDFALGGTTSTQTQNQILCHVPTVTCLALNMAIPTPLSSVADYSEYSVVGSKSFKIVEAGKSWTQKYKDIDRVLWQKYGTLLFKTNGSYAAREKFTDGPCVHMGGFNVGMDEMANQFGMGEWAMMNVSHTFEFSNRIILTPVAAARISAVLIKHGHQPIPLKATFVREPMAQKEDGDSLIVERPQPQGDLTRDQLLALMKLHLGHQPVQTEQLGTGRSNSID